MNLLVGFDQTVAEWVGRKIGIPVAPPYTALGWLDNEGTLRVGFIFYGYSPGGNVDMAVASSGRLTKSVIQTVAKYVFRGIAASRLTARPPLSNAAACDILTRIGFKRECICKSYYGTNDAVQFRMLKSEATRWLS